MTAVKHSMDSLQTPAVLGTSNIVSKVLQRENWNLSGGVHHWFKRRSSGERKPVINDDDDDDDDDGFFPEGKGAGTW